MPPPMGEGSSYVASFSDLRPSLDWSPEDGWTLPTPKVAITLCHVNYLAIMSLVLLSRLSWKFYNAFVSCLRVDQLLNYVIKVCLSFNSSAHQLLML